LDDDDAMKWGPDRTQSIRGLAGVAGALVWFGGLHALPFLHNLDHGPNHTHAAPGHFHSHPEANNPAHPDRHAHPHVHESPPLNDDGHGPTDPDHGDGSLLHFAAAIIASQPVMLPKLSYKIIPVSMELSLAVDIPALHAFLARGPPTF
jgi:hypothetical protein